MRVKVVQAIEKIFGGRRGPELNVHVVPVECTSYSSLDLRDFGIDTQICARVIYQRIRGQVENA
jgi:hypothetical protein